MANNENMELENSAENVENDGAEVTVEAVEVQESDSNGAEGVEDAAADVAEDNEGDGVGGSELVRARVAQPESTIQSEPSTPEGVDNFADGKVTSSMGLKDVALQPLSATPVNEDQEPDEEYETIAVRELETVKLGRQGENDTQTVVIDCSEWLTKLPGCDFMIAATRPGEREVYLPEVSVDGGVVTWPILEQDTALSGWGRAEVRAMKDGKIKKSALFKTRIEPALENDARPDAPTPPNWVKVIIGSVETAEEAATTAQAQVQGAEEAAQAAQEAAEAAQAAAEGAVRYNAAQSLTDDEKAQARENIDAASEAVLSDLAGGAVRFDEAQGLTNDQKAQARENIKAIQQHDSPYTGKILNIMGDSISRYPQGHTDTPWQVWVKDLLGFAKVNTDAISGTSFAQNTAHPEQAFCLRYTEMTDNADVVIIAGGVNDVWHDSVLGEFGDTGTDTVYGALEVLCSGLRAKYPLAEILFLTPTEQNHADCINDYGVIVKDVADAIKTVCAKYAIDVYDNRVLSGIYPQISANASRYTDDKLHWNSAGHEKTGRDVANYLLRRQGYAGYHYIDPDGDNEPTPEPKESVTYHPVDVGYGEGYYNRTGVIGTYTNSNGNKACKTNSIDVTGYATANVGTNSLNAVAWLDSAGEWIKTEQYAENVGADEIVTMSPDIPANAKYAVLQFFDNLVSDVYIELIP